MKVFVLFLLLALVPFTQAQKKGNYYVTAGATQYFGDIGDFGNGGEYRLSDIRWQMTRANLGIGYQYFFNRFFGVKSALQFGQIEGDDALSNNPDVINRNVHFRTDIVQISGLLTLRVPVGRLAYVFAHSGITGLYFNPLGEYNGGWHKLRPIGTEGQNLPGEPGPYASFTAAIPYGGGFVIPIGKFGIGLDLTGHYVFNDYLDDVSDTWGDPEAIAENTNNPDAAYALSTPANGINLEGDKRGNPKSKDFYYYLNVSLHFNLNSDNPYKYLNRKMHNTCPDF